MASNQTPERESGISLAEHAYRILEARIVLGELEPGTMVSETSLAKSLEVGRMPIREALQRLAYDGLVAIHPRRGVMIPDASVDTELKLLEVRRPLQNLTAKLASRRGNKQQKARMLSLADELEVLARQGDGDKVLHVLRDAHHVITEATSNEYIQRSMGPVQGLTRRFWFLYKTEQDLYEGARLNAEVLRAASSGDEKRAEALSNSLMDYLEQFARRQLDL